jgi:hypothetical protein
MPLEICPHLDTVRCPDYKAECHDSQSAACINLKRIKAYKSTVSALMSLDLPQATMSELSATLAILEEKAG